MNKRLFTLVLAGALALSLVACGSKDGEKIATKDGGNVKQTESNNTSQTTKEKATFNFLYGWESNEIPVCQPEGTTVTVNGIYDPNYVPKENVMTNNLLQFDGPDENWYATVKDWCSEWNLTADELPQYYWSGTLNADTATFFDDYAQTVTDLEIKLNGKPVKYIQTFEEGVPYDAFVGIEYDYASNGENHGKGLLGLHIIWSNVGTEPLTKEQSVWLFGEAFGVETGISNPFVEVVTEEVVITVDAGELLGTWLERDSSWDNTYIFNADGTGTLISGPEYPFTYDVNGDVLTLTYGVNDSDEYTISVDGDLLTMIDKFGNELLLDKQVIKSEEPKETEKPVETESENPYVKQIVATWVDKESGYQETFTFNADGTGMYSYVDGERYEFPITYNFLRSDYVEFFYEDGSEGGFIIRIEGDTMYVTNDAVVDMPLVRQ